MSDERTQLEHARALIINKQYDEARAILLTMPGSETARKWLAKLDEIAPSTPPAYALPSADQLAGDAPAPQALPPAAQTISLTLNVTLARYLIAALVTVLGLIMIIGFFAFPWMDLSNVSFFGLSLDALADSAEVDKGPLEVTAIEIWMGKNDGENFVISNTNGEGGIGAVRLLDRFLALIPLGGLLLTWLAWSYVVDVPLRRAMLVAMTVVALVMFIFPFAWEDLSNNALEDEINESMQSESGSGDFDLDFGFGEAMVGFFSDMYSTGEQKALGGLAFFACVAGLVIEFAPQFQPHRAG
jgi:hypothetical protein